MHTGCVAMVRNEADIAACWLHHLAGLFDEIYIADHLSKDGTIEQLDAFAAAHGDRVKIFKYEDPAYRQEALMNFLSEQLIESRPGLDWLTSLDADEFLAFKDRGAFEDFLKEQSEEQAFSLKWKNCAPVDFASENPLSSEWLTAPKFAYHGKVFFRPSLVTERHFTIAQGNHYLKRTGDQSPHFPEVRGHLYHLPIRSADQFRLKITQGVETYLSLGQDRRAGEGQHWFDLFDRFLSEDFAVEELYRASLEYGNPEPSRMSSFNRCRSASDRPWWLLTLRLMVLVILKQSRPPGITALWLRMVRT